MTKQKDISKYLPLTETTYYTMLSLVEPLHGYALMQKASEISQGTVQVGAGTLYTIFSTLEKENLIVLISEADRRKTYALTPTGKKVLLEQIKRLEIMAASGKEVKNILMQQ